MTFCLLLAIVFNSLFSFIVLSDIGCYPSFNIQNKILVVVLLLTNLLIWKEIVTYV